MVMLLVLCFARGSEFFDVLGHLAALSRSGAAE